jgi:hypothetical protein
MKHFTSQLFILMVAAIFFTSCGKDGAVGPAGSSGATGATGATGAVGPAGPAGANGTKGSVIYSGSTTPVSTTGAVGDFYINLSTGLLYGPKTSAGWGTGISLKGTTGATGAAGSKIYSGATVPTSTTGAVGDFYLDIATYMLYGPKTTTGWGTPLNLRGAVGPQGPAGPQGPPGNANVITTVFSLTSSQWLWNSVYEFQTNSSSYTEYFTRYSDNAVPSITQNVLDDGMVLVYFTPNTTDNTNQWAPLPYEFTDGSDTFNYEIAYETNVGTVRLHYFFVQTVASATIPVLSTFPIATYKFKVIAVTGTLSTALRTSHINLADYQAVSRFTGVWQQDK